MLLFVDLSMALSHIGSDLCLDGPRAARLAYLAGSCVRTSHHLEIEDNPDRNGHGGAKGREFDPLD